MKIEEGHIVGQKISLIHIIMGFWRFKGVRDQNGQGARWVYGERELC